MSAAALAAASAVGAFFLLRPDLRELTFVEVRDWLCLNPLGQAALFYVATAIVMLAIPECQLTPAFLAVCAYSVITES